MQTNILSSLVSSQRAGPLGTYHALPAQEVGNDLLVYVVQQAPWALVVVPGIDKELPPGVVINEWTDLQVREMLTVIFAWLPDFQRLNCNVVL